MTATGAEPEASPILEGNRRRSDWSNGIAILLACAIFAGLSAWLGYKSEGDLEADATTHFLIARYAFKEHHYFTSVWGRPLCTAAYALAARIGTVEEGRFAARLTSLAMALVVALLTYLIAKRQRFRTPALVVILLLAQPVFFLHSFSELTEIPFAAVLMLAFVLYQRKQWLLMALATGLLPLGRPEGFGFILMAGVALVAHGRARWLWALVVPFVLWSFAGFCIADALPPAHVGIGWWIFNREWPTWVFRQWPYSYQSPYGRGALLSFVARLPILVGPIFFPFMLIGLWLELRWIHPDRRDGGWFSWFTWLKNLTHERRCEIWIVLIPLSILVVHSLLWWRGKMGSNGELRYLVIVGPFFALAGARGWEWVWQRLHWNIPLICAGLAALVPVAINHDYPMVPFPLYADGVVAREIARWYESDAEIRADYPRIMPTPPNVFFFMDLSQTDARRAIAASKRTIAQAPPGTLLVWDPIYGPNNSDRGMCVTEEEIRDAGWIYQQRFEEGGVYCEIYLSPKKANGTPSE